MKKAIYGLLGIVGVLFVGITLLSIYRYDNIEILYIDDVEGWEVSGTSGSDLWRTFRSLDREGIEIGYTSPSPTVTNNFNIYQMTESVLTSEIHDLREAPQENNKVYRVIIAKPNFDNKWDTAELIGSVENLDDFDYMVENMQKFVDNSEWDKRPEISFIDKIADYLLDLVWY